MKKLSAAQFDSIRNRQGLLPAAVWQQCISYLHAHLSDADPPSSTSFVDTMMLLKMFVDWALQVAKKQFGDTGYECLLLASSKEMSSELLHPLDKAQCVFSRRRSLMQYTSESHPAPMTVCCRVQRRFHWWAYHEQTAWKALTAALGSSTNLNTLISWWACMCWVI